MPFLQADSFGILSIFFLLVFLILSSPSLRGPFCGVSFSCAGWRTQEYFSPFRPVQSFGDGPSIFLVLNLFVDCQASLSFVMPTPDKRQPRVCFF